MKHWLSPLILSAVFLFSGNGFCEEDEESREADTECEEEGCNEHFHYRYPHFYQTQESDIEIEREEVDWPGRREDDLFNELTH